MVREIYTHYVNTEEFYETKRLSALTPEKDDPEARDWLETALLRLAREAVERPTRRGFTWCDAFGHILHA